MVKVCYFGHSFFKVAFPGRNILFDPYIEGGSKDPAFKRLLECAAGPNDLKDTALILISHEHFDHFDKALIESVASRDNSLVVAAEQILQQLSISKRLLHPIKMNETLNLRGIEITAVPAHHPQAFYPLGFMVSYSGKSVFHSGDTDLIDSFSSLKPDLALLPIGGTYTMDCVDAVRAVKTMKPRFAIPMHYNTFKMIEQDPKEFKQRIDKSILKTKPVILKPGQSFSFK
ncbi:MAG: metal-dependent hydrolase [Candidatus Diapherotrites archaeon]|uniref:Metal-dependent hydrolase n=1 Tax=Candidatus Iainarchaeum sp. TaxID=3101447 RepID=A0A938YP99_9ARCH|nr:metal-dependent hydrolase [Candidatus Diapherotrites archaeon]